MSRVTDAEVKTLLAPYADNADVTLFIEAAGVIVDEELVGKGLSEARLRMIELNLAAHYATVSIERGGFTYQKAGNSQEGYVGTEGQVKLSSTRFGQQALAMDSTGSLAVMDSPKGTAEFQVISAREDRPGYWSE